MRSTIVDYFKEHIKSRHFVYEIETGRRLSFRAVYEKAFGQTGFFHHAEQKVIAVILPNSISYITTFLSVLMTGNIFNPLPYFVEIQELDKIFQYIDPHCIITDRKDIFEKYQGRFCVMHPSDSVNPSLGNDQVVDVNMPACLYYSSGTTGDPKGILYSHRNMISLISSIIRGFKFTSLDRQLALLPFGHTASINYNILPALMVGCDLYISKGFEHLRSNFFAVLAKYSITYTEIVPTILFMLCKLNFDLSSHDLRQLRFIGCGSSTLPLGAQKEFIEKYGIQVANLYGLSETGPSHIDNPTEEDWQPGSIGVPLDVNECKIASDGEILIKGDNVFVGYYNNEEAYHNAVKDGWFHTGDFGAEQNGKFYFLDRKKDLIIKGGINITPSEVEEVIYRHPNVLECVVVGRGNPLFGEEIVAVVVPKIKTDLSESGLVVEILRLCKNNLSNYKIPVRILIWDELPKTYSNKILRRKVRDFINAKQEVVTGETPWHQKQLPV